MNSNNSNNNSEHFAPLFGSLLTIEGLISKYNRKIILIFLINLVVFLLFYFFKSKVYKTELIITSSVITSERVSIIIEPLGNLARENNYKELAQLMNLDSLTAAHISDISAKELKDETKQSTDNYDGEILRQQNCLVTLKVLKDKKLADTIQSGILYYVRNNEFIRRRSEIERQNLEYMKARIQREIKELDALKDKLTLNKAGFSMMDPSAINNSIANLYGQELAINSKMQMEDRGINIIRNITNFKSPVSPKLWLNLVAAVLLSFFFSVLMIFITEFKEFRKRVS